MSHNESTRPSSCASRGRAGRSPPVIFRIMDWGVTSLNGNFPVKTYSGTRTSSESSIPPPATLGVRRYKNQPLSRPCQKQTCPLPVRFYQLLRGSLARPTLQCIPLSALQGQSAFRERSKQARNPSNGRDHYGRRECWAGQGLLAQVGES